MNEQELMSLPREALERQCRELQVQLDGMRFALDSVEQLLMLAVGGVHATKEKEGMAILATLKQVSERNEERARQKKEERHAQGDGTQA